jgi:hypothetical protein
MMRPNRSSPCVFVSSTVGTTLVSILAAWVISSLAFAPLVTTPDVPRAGHSKSGHHLFQISPVPPGADWVRS